MVVRGKAAAAGIWLGVSLGISGAAILGAWQAPARADAGVRNVAGLFNSSGALDATSLGDVRTGLAAAPGRDEDDELRRKRPTPSDTDPLRSNRDADPLFGQSDLSNPFTANLTFGTSPINQTPAATNPPPATNNPPAATNPPPANNTPVANNPQNTIPITNNSSLGSIISGTATIGASVITTLRLNGLAQ